MLSTLGFSLILAAGITAPPPDSPQVIEQTIRADSGGQVQVERRSVDPGVSALRTVNGSGVVGESTTRPDARVLIELRARPRLDRMAPSSAAEISSQQAQLARDLGELDRKHKARTASKITRQYDMLFAGVAATVDSALVAEIQRLPNVKTVHRDVEIHANLTESVPQIGAPTVWSTYSVDGTDVKVAVIDTGIDYTHPDLGGCFGSSCKVAGGYDFVNFDGDPRDDNGHGTHVAGIVAANGTLKGVAPGAKLLAYKVLDQYGTGYTASIISALEAAVAAGAKVVNLSLGGQGYPDDPSSQAVDNATAAGVLCVVAAGNSGFHYLSIESPGTARTALTVGAADKSWVMAYFSSRGYVADGDQFLMKPEIVAPGVDIRSTVPTTGTYGDPSGYKILSGTSMATPHIAGAAALLLQWNAAQSPADLKSRLVASGRSLNTDPFKEGAGGVDLVKAFGLPVLTNQTHLSFGVIEASNGTVVRERTLSLRNTAATSTTLSLSASPALPTGATLEILPSSLTLAAGQSADVTVRLTVDAAVLPTPPDPYIWSTRLSIAGGGQSATVPLYVFRGAVLALYFDETPWFIRLYTETGTSRNFNFQGRSLTTVVSPGTWDVQVAYHPPVALVVKEQQNVQTRLELSFARGDATHAVTLLAIDDAGQSLREYSFRRELLYAPTASSFPDKVTELTTISSGDNFRVSPLSSRYLIGATGAGPDAGGVRFFASDWAGQGLSSGVTLPFTGVPYRRLAQAALPPAGATQAFLQNGSGFVMKATWGGIGSLFSLSQAGELSRWVHIQSNVTPGVPMMPVYQSSLNSYAPNLSFIDWIDGTYYRQTTGENLEINRTAFFNFIDPSLQPETVLGAAVQRWDLDTPPHSLPIEFLNLPEAIGLNSGSGTWVTHTISSVYLRAGAEPTFDLYRNGALVGTYPLSSINWGRIQTQAGPHELRATSAYTINGTAGSSQVVASFDTSKGDLNPPAVSKFRIEQNGIRTATPLYPANNATPHVKFRVTDPSPFTVTLEWRQNGTSTWTSLPLTQSQTDYDAALSQGGSIDLRVTATDSFGNKFEEVWTPAVITAAAAPPPTPAYVRATRAGTAAIGVSWPPSESQSGISGYRIERLPDNKIVTTSGTGTTYTDTAQLVAGQSYFYRVSAIDVNNAVSAPTGYDVATLVELADEPVVPRVTPIRGTHIADLRRAVDAVRQATGLAKAWTNYNPPTGVVLASHFTELRDRLNEALSTMSLSLVNFTWYVAPGQEVQASSLQELRDGVK